MRPCILVPEALKDLLRAYNERLPITLEEQIERTVSAKALEVEGRNLTAVFTSHIGAVLSDLPDDLRFQPPPLPFRYAVRKDKIEVIPSQKQTHTVRTELRKRWEPILRAAGGSPEDIEMFFSLTGLNAPASVEDTIKHIGETLTGRLTEDGIRWTPSFLEETTPAFDFYIAATLKNFAGYIEELGRRGKATPVMENALPLIKAGAQRFEKRYFTVAKQGREITKTSVSKTVLGKIDIDLAEEQFLTTIHPHLAKQVSPLRLLLSEHYGVPPDKAPLAFFINAYEEQVRNIGGYAKYEDIKDTLFFRRLKWSLHTALGAAYKEKSDEIELIAKSIVEGRPDPRVKAIYDYTPYAVPAPAAEEAIAPVRVLPEVVDAYTNDTIREAYSRVRSVLGDSPEADDVIGVLNLKRAELNISYDDAADYIGTLAARISDTSKLPPLSPSASKLVAENLAIAEDVAEELLSRGKIRFEQYKDIQRGRKYYESRAETLTPAPAEEKPAPAPTPAPAEEKPAPAPTPAEGRGQATPIRELPESTRQRYAELRKRAEQLMYPIPEDPLRYYDPSEKVRTITTTRSAILEGLEKREKLSEALTEAGFSDDLMRVLSFVDLFGRGVVSDLYRLGLDFERLAERMVSREYNPVIREILTNKSGQEFPTFLSILEDAYFRSLRKTQFDPPAQRRVEKAFDRILSNMGIRLDKNKEKFEELLIERLGGEFSADSISDLFKRHMDDLRAILLWEMSERDVDTLFELLTFNAVEYRKKGAVKALKKEHRSMFAEARKAIKERVEELPLLPIFSQKGLSMFEDALRKIAQKEDSWVAEELADTIRTLLDTAPKRDFMYVNLGMKVDIMPMPQFSIQYMEDIREPLIDFLRHRLPDRDSERLLHYLGYDVVSDFSWNELVKYNEAGLFRERLKEFIRDLHNGEIRWELPNDVVMVLEEISHAVSTLTKGQFEEVAEAFTQLSPLVYHLSKTNEYLSAIRRGEDVFAHFERAIAESFGEQPPPRSVAELFGLSESEYNALKREIREQGGEPLAPTAAPTVEPTAEPTAATPAPASTAEPPAPALTAERVIEEQVMTPEEFTRQVDEGLNPPPPEAPSVADFPDEPREYLSFAEYASGQAALLRDYLFEQRGLMHGNEEVLNLALNAVDAYFVSNGKFGEVMSSLQSLTAAALKSHSEIEILEKLERNGRLLKLDGGVLTLKDPEVLKGRVAELRSEVPILYFFDDETIAGYAVMEDFIAALADGNNRNVMEMLRDVLPYRVLNPNRVEEIPTIITVLAGAMRTDDREKALRGIEALLNRFTDEELNEIKHKLADMVVVGTMSAIVRSAYEVVPILEFQGGRLTKDEFNALSDDAKRALLLRTVKNDKEWEVFALNFTDDPAALRSAIMRGTTTETVLRHPYLLDALMTYSREMGFSPIGLTAGAKIIRNHIDAMRRIFFHHKTPAPMKMMLEEYGGNALRLLYTELGAALRSAGQREAEFLLRDVVERSTPSLRVSGEALEEIDDEVFAFEVLKNLLGMPNDIDGMPALKRAINHAANIVFPMKALYQEAVAANIGEELIPLLSAFAEQGLINEVISPVATGLSQVPLRPLLRKAYGEFAEESMRFIVDNLDPHIRALYYTYQQAGRGHEFELYVPHIVADIIAKPDFLNTKNLLDALNNAFKSVLIVYNPPAVLRNAFTNTMLLYHVGYDTALEIPFMRGLKAQLDAWREIRSGSQFVRELEELDPSLSLLRVYERLAEWEVINNFDARAVRVFRYISNLPFLRNMHYVQSMSEASAKVAAVRELLKARGKLNNYTREDLMQAITEVNEWLINYRVVPPTVHFLRKSLGLFPFITFTLTTMVNFARHPDRFMKEALRAAVYKERFSNVIGALFGEPTMQPMPQATQRASLHALLPEYMKNNPLVMAVPQRGDRLSVLDFSFWFPLGVFEQQTGVGYPIPIPQLAPFVALANPHDTIKRYMGGVVRPFTELVLNKELLTDTPIVDENLPISEQMKQRGSFIVRNIPLLRLAFETMGVDELAPLGRARTNEPIDKLTAWIGMRGYHLSELEMGRLKALESKVHDIKKAMSSLFKNPNLSAQRKVELFRAYQEELENTLKEYEKHNIYYVPMFFRADEENAVLINSPAEFRSTMFGLFAKRRWNSMNEFNAEMFQDLSVLDEPLELGGITDEAEE